MIGGLGDWRIGGLSMERLSRAEFRSWLEQRTRDFSVSVFKFLDALPKKVSTKVIAYQLGKSASSIGANYREANRSESSDDFCHKMAIALKEANETEYWLAVLTDLYPMHGIVEKLRLEALELLKLFQSILGSSRENARKKKSGLKAI